MPMDFILLLYPITCLLSYALALHIAKLSFRVGAVDLPDGGRKLHKMPMPKLGGVGIYSAFAVGLILDFLLVGADFRIFGGGVGTAPDRLAFLQLTFGAASVIIGAADDVFSYGAAKKLTLGAALSLISALYMTDFSDFALPMTYFLRVLGNALFILLIMNAFNMSDGADGLCATLALVPLLFLSGNSAAGLVFFSVLGFLPHNIPAKIYLGESGAGFLGYFAAVTFLYGGADGGAIFAFLPYIVELTSTVIRRAALGKHPFSADRGHIHHKLIALGFNPHGVASVMTAAAALISAAALIVG